MKKSQVSRRGLLHGAAAVVAAPYVITSSALGAGDRPPASERIVMGCIGTGGMGTGDMNGFLGDPRVQVVAVCDVDAERRDRAKGKVEARYSKDKPGGYKGCDTYNDFRELLARDDIDATTNATPDHWHALIVCAAAEAGKDMYGQKPLSLTLQQGRIMSDTVQRYGTVYQTGSQQRSDRRFRFACELVRNGRLGKIHTMEVGLPGGSATGTEPEMPIPEGFDYDFWLGPAPVAPYTKKRCHYTFRWILDYSGGQVTDWGAHHCDIAQWGVGKERTGPISAEGEGEFPVDGLYNAATQYRFVLTYPDRMRMICSSKFPNGVKWIGEKGWVFVKRGGINAEPESLLSEKIGPNEIHLYESNNHRGNFIDCVYSRGETVAPIEIAHRSISCAHLGNIAMMLQRKVQWDPDKEYFPNDPEAQRMTGRAMREPWVL